VQSLLRQLHQRGACALWPHVPLQLLCRCGASAAACAASCAAACAADCAATCLLQARAPGLPPPQTLSLSRSLSPFHSRWLSLKMHFTHDGFHSLYHPLPPPQTKSRAAPSAAPTYRSACAPSCRERQRALHACDAVKHVHCVLCVCAVKHVCDVRRKICIVYCI